MLEGDQGADLQALAAEMADERIHWFHDPGHLAGCAVAEALGAPGHVAWDTYLVYGRQAQWGHALPASKVWMHQLSETWADPSHQRLEEELQRELKTAIRTGLNG